MPGESENFPPWARAISEALIRVEMRYENIVKQVDVRSESMVKHLDANTAATDRLTHEMNRVNADHEVRLVRVEDVIEINREQAKERVTTWKAPLINWLIGIIGLFLVAAAIYLISHGVKP